MQPQYSVRLHYGQELYFWNLSAYDLYDEILFNIETLPNFPLNFSLFYFNQDQIPEGKITSNRDLNKLFEQSSRRGSILDIGIISKDIDCFEFRKGNFFNHEKIKKIEGPKLEGILEDLSVIKNSARKQIDAQVVNFLLGRTGQGKSTLTNHLQGFHLICEKVGINFYLTPLVAEKNGELKIAEIGNRAKSCTSLPGYFPTQSGEIICDLAGFVDTNGPKQEIRNSFSNLQVFVKDRLIRIILVVEWATLEAHRGQSFVDTIDRIRKLFRHNFLEIVAYCSAIIVTKVSYDLQKDDVVEEIRRISTEKSELNEEDKIYLQTILDNQRIGIVRLPKKIKQNQYQLFFEENISEFISSVPIGALSENSNISLSQQSCLQLRQILKKLEQALWIQIEALADKYPVQKTSQNNQEKLGIYCYEIDEALRILSATQIFPYNLDELIKAVKILGLNVNTMALEETAGAFIKGMKICCEILPNFQFRTDLFENFFAFLNRKQKIFMLKVQCFYDNEEVKEMAKEKIRELNEYEKQLQVKKNQYLEKMRKDNENRNAEYRNELAKLNQEVKRRNEQNQRELEQLRRRRR